MPARVPGCSDTASTFSSRSSAAFTMAYWRAQKLSRSGLFVSMRGAFALAVGYFWNSREVESDASVFPSSPDTSPGTHDACSSALPKRPCSPTVSPRSPADYIAIASAYQSVVISNVPVLHDTADNAARRFISVIDEFYDRGVNVVISAAAAPAELYKGEKLKFEFQRTASRLTEMQTAEYLARAHRAA